MNDPELWINVDDRVVHPDAPRGGAGQGHCKSAGTLGCNLDFDLDVPHPFSPEGRNTSPSERQAHEILDAGTPKIPGAGAPDEVPVFNDLSGPPFTINADTVQEFANRANNAMGDGGAVGHMVPEVKTDNVEIDGRGKVEKANMIVNTKIVRPRLGLCRFDTERALIKQAEELIKGHEERHRDIAKDFMTRACKAMRGQPGSKAMALVDKFIEDMNRAQARLDSVEGQLYVDHNGPSGKAGPATGVRLGPVQAP